MKEIIGQISELLQNELNSKDIELDREVSRNNTAFYIKIDTNNRYIFKITDMCIENNRNELIIKNIIDSAIQILKENPNKNVLMKLDLSISIPDNE